MADSGLTDKQYERMVYLVRRRSGKTTKTNGDPEAPLTENMVEELRGLLAAHNRPELPRGAKSYCQDWLKSKVYQRRKEFTAAATEKGMRGEDDAIELLAQHESDPFMVKHEGRQSDGFIEGECDVLPPEEVFDIKCSKDAFTFPLWEEIVAKGYHDQLQGYGHLYGRKKLALAYCLVNTPEDVIEKNAFYKTRGKYGPDFTQDQYQAILEEETRNNTYDDVPIQLRVKVYRFAFDPAFIGKVIKRVKMCREYIATLEEKLIAEGKHPLYPAEHTPLKKAAQC